MLLEVWRHVGRNVNIQEATDAIADVVATALRCDVLAVRGLDLERGRLETLAWARCGSGAARGDAPPLVSRVDLDEIASWCRRREPAVVAPGGDDGPAARLVPSGWGGSALVGPLVTGGRYGALLVLVRSARAPGPNDLRAFGQLLEPFAVALANEARVQELGRLRERFEADNRALLSRLARHDISDGVVGVEAGLKEVMERVAQVAPTDAPVLILGETGSGKEVVAREIHARSRRSTGPIVRVNCGAIPPELVDSELFGHERGSFTGAVSLRKGWFERADGGTLFLDEVGELPPAAQVRLLRVLQDGTFERVGGQRALTVDVRIVAATHRELGAMVRDGRFRQDLWYRLGVFPVRLPPLRDRPEDIPALAEHFAAGAGRRLGGVPLVPSPADVATLLDYPWPGNVRELAAVIERAVILGDGRRLEVVAALGTRPPGAAGAAPEAHPASAPPARFPTLDDAMLAHVEAALVRCGGRIEGAGGAAALLDVNPHTLRSRMRKHGFDWTCLRR